MSCTGGVLSEARTLEEVVAEIAATRVSERGETRADDRFSRGGDGGQEACWLLLSTMLATELLRLVTCGSVDDGKSTLIGRLLFDSKQILVDQLEHIEETSERRGDGYVNLALLTDGLRAEREQGITIDVAYRSFVTPRRRFLLADAPGHVQYTRNMVTGASTAELAVVLARRPQGRRRADAPAHLPRGDTRDPARGGGREQDGSRRLLGGALPRDRGRARGARLPGWAHATCWRFPSRPCTATTSSSAPSAMPWYEGPTLLEHLETVEIAGDRNLDRPPLPGPVGDPADGRGVARLPRLRRPGRLGGLAHRRRGRRPAVRLALAGRRGGDGRRARSTSRRRRMSVTIRLEDDLDIGRGDMLADPERPPVAARQLETRVCWMSERPLEPRARLAIKSGTRWSRAVVDEIDSVVDVHTLEQVPAERARAERHRHRAPAARRAARRRPIRGESSHGRVRARRRGDERHGRRRHGARRRQLSRRGQAAFTRWSRSPAAAGSIHRRACSEQPPWLCSSAGCWP